MGDRMGRNIWRTIKTAAWGYVADDCLSRGAAIAYYTIFAFAPVLVIVITTAGIFFGEAAARGAIVDQVGGFIGRPGAETVQTMVQTLAHGRSGTIATVIGLATLLVAATGVFGEVQAALNIIWKVETPPWTIWQLVRTRLRGLLLVLIMGVLLLVALLVSTALALANRLLVDVVADIDVPLRLLNFGASFVLVTATFAAIYKVLPDTQIGWRDVGTGAAVTALLFTIGKTLIGLYVATSTIASSFGAASTVAVLLLWVYYSVQIFLFGAELTHVHARRERPARTAQASLTLAADAPAGERVAFLRRQLEANSLRRRARAR